MAPTTVTLESGLMFAFVHRAGCIEHLRLPARPLSLRGWLGGRPPRHDGCLFGSDLVYFEGLLCEGRVPPPTSPAVFDATCSSKFALACIVKKSS